jgi:hypothetical protein
MQADGETIAPDREEAGVLGRVRERAQALQGEVEQPVALARKQAEHEGLLAEMVAPRARFLLDQPTTSAGRHPDSDIFLDDVTVSRRHAEFRRDGAEFVVVDVGSLNGTYVNREPVDTAVLANGDEVQIGKFRLVFLTGPRDGGSAGAGSETTPATAPPSVDKDPAAPAGQDLLRKSGRRVEYLSRCRWCRGAAQVPQQTGIPDQAPVRG